METLAIVGTLFSVVGQVASASQQASQLKSQAQVVEAQTESSIALEKASAAERTLDRLRALRQITGDIITKGVGAGISISSGSIGNLIADSQGQYSREQDIQEFNVRQSTTAKRISGQSDVNVLRAQASNTRLSGYIGAAGTLMNYGMDSYNRGKVPQ